MGLDLSSSDRRWWWVGLDLSSSSDHQMARDAPATDGTVGARQRAYGKQRGGISGGAALSVDLSLFRSETAQNGDDNEVRYQIHRLLFLHHLHLPFSALGHRSHHLPFFSLCCRCRRRCMGMGALHGATPPPNAPLALRLAPRLPSSNEECVASFGSAFFSWDRQTRAWR
uniref:Uncharacterized protein n=1 Tax=Oryza punctata TaxID=4537 RepID=A0A0E0KZM4_ORYPU